MPDQPEIQGQETGAQPPSPESLVGRAVQTPQGEFIGRIVGVDFGYETTVRTPNFVSVESHRPPTLSSFRGLLDALPNDQRRALFARSFIWPERQYAMPRTRQDEPETYPRWWQRTIERMAHLRLTGGDIPTFQVDPSTFLTDPIVFNTTSRDGFSGMVLADLDVLDVEMRMEVGVYQPYPSIDLTVIGRYQNFDVRIAIQGEVRTANYLSNTRIIQMTLERPDMLTPPSVTIQGNRAFGDTNVERFTVSCDHGEVRVERDGYVVPLHTGGTVDRHIQRMRDAVDAQISSMMMGAFMGPEAEASSGIDPRLSAAVYQQAIGRLPTVSEALALAAQQWKDQRSALRVSDEVSLNREERRARRFRHQPEGRYQRSIHEQLEARFGTPPRGEPALVLGWTTQGYDFTQDDFVAAMETLARVGRDLIQSIHTGIHSLREVAQQIVEPYSALREAARIAGVSQMASAAFDIVSEQYRQHYTAIREAQEAEQQHLAGIRERARIVEQRHRTEAQKIADELLTSRLSVDQQETYRKAGYFDVVVPSERLNGKLPRRYRITNQGASNNIKLVSEERGETIVLASFCVHPSDYGLPQADIMLAQKLMIEHEHEEFLRVANSYPYPQFESSPYYAEMHAREIDVTSVEDEGPVTIFIDDAGRPILRQYHPGTAPRHILREAAAAALADESP